MDSDALLELLHYLQTEEYHFVTATPATHRRVNARSRNQVSLNLSDIFGWSRPFARSLLPEALTNRLIEGLIVVQTSDGWKSKVRVSTLGGDLFLHSAFPTAGLDSVFFGPDTYRFARAIRHHLLTRDIPIRRALDIGCGSGAGAVTIARGVSDAEVLMSDINGTALQMAFINVKCAGLHNVRALHSDLFDKVDGDFDLIVANPPYLNDPLGRIYRHGGGQFGSAMSLRIVEQAASHLSPRGSLLLYTGTHILDGVDGFQNAVRLALSNGTNWSYEEIDPDVFGEELEQAPYERVDRIAVVVITLSRHGATAC
jgi:SAM-dependent methyltransferase